MTDATNSSQPLESDKVINAAAELRGIKALLHYKLNSVQSDVNIPDLSGKSGYYAVVNPTGDGFTFQQSPAGTGSAGDLASQLLSSTDFTKGAGQVAANLALNYPAGSVGDVLKTLTTAAGSLASVLTNNVLFNGECYKLDPNLPVSTSTSWGSRARIGFGWGAYFSVTSTLVGGLAAQVQGVGYQTNTNYNHGQYAEMQTESSYNSGTNTINVAQITAVGACRLDSNTVPGVVVTFDLSTNITGNICVVLVITDGTKYIKYPVLVNTVANLSVWNSYSFVVPSYVSALTANSELYVGLQFYVVAASTAKDLTANTWNSFTATHNAHQAIAGLSNDFASGPNKYLRAARVKVEFSSTGIASPFVYKTKALAQIMYMHMQASLLRSADSGIYTGTNLYVDMLAPELPYMFNQSVGALPDYSYAQGSMTVYGSNGTSSVSFTQASWTLSGVGGGADRLTAAITSGALGSTSGVWTAVGPQRVLMWVDTTEHPSVSPTNGALLKVVRA